MKFISIIAFFFSSVVLSAIVKPTLTRSVKSNFSRSKIGFKSQSHSVESRYSREKPTGIFSGSKPSDGRKKPTFTKSGPNPSGKWTRPTGAHFDATRSGKSERPTPTGHNASISSGLRPNHLEGSNGKHFSQYIRSLNKRDVFGIPGFDEDSDEISTTTSSSSTMTEYSTVLPTMVFGQNSNREKSFCFAKNCATDFDCRDGCLRKRKNAICTQYFYLYSSICDLS
ncbi:hypothetical protein AYI68_g8350 [Smittium mucronatum]|uniref:Uncharacterized protein n=1 Tax=Smittium mucronatum TaxID=133383 RepID=A0A1R0GL59_9FUNG|nr:hypothetical protein AYI68_g8350 [Smittium mucronatum]